MSRYFAQIKVIDLEQKILNAGVLTKEEGREWSPYDFQMRLPKGDLKVNFNFENFDFGQGETKYFRPKDSLIGYHTLENGLTFCGMSSGGHWETPVFFVVYWDGKKLRVYVPTKGNPWNTKTKEAYGNDENSDIEDSSLREKKGLQGYPESVPVWKLVKEDIEKHFLPSSQEKTKRVIKVKNKELPLFKERSLQERVEELTFYGTGDEAYELFEAGCSFCYKLFGLGWTTEAEIVYIWLKEMAICSVLDAKENGQENETDFAKGRWCN